MVTVIWYVKVAGLSFRSVSLKADKTPTHCTLQLRKAFPALKSYYRMKHLNFFCIDHNVKKS